MPLDPVALCDGIDRAAATLGKRRLAVAFSGGLDSTVLLTLVASGSTLPVRALHVEHGLQGEQPDWRAHVVAACERRDLSLHVLDAQVTPARGDSVEAAARTARYAAFSAALGDDELLLLAQHRDDQAETLLLQLLRGAGPAGLAAMPAVAELGRSHLLRPLLGCDREALQDYARTHALRWFDDPSNADDRFDRNYLRREVMPRLRERWPGLATTLSRASDWQAEADRLASTLAAADARRLAPQPARIDVSRWSALTPDRQRNLLRFLCRAQSLTTPPASRLESLQALALGDTPRGEVRWPGGEARRYRHWLHLTPPLPAPPEDTWTGAPGDAGTLDLPEPYGRLHYNRATLEGVAVECRFRQGGERVRRDPDAHSAPFAAWCQQEGIAPWLRLRLPLTFVGDTLAVIGTRAVSPDFAPWVPRWTGAPPGLDL
ncbi:MAG: tRNA lysidine(34) synthetase TilS [Pseudomonadota bacterium]